MWKRKKRNTQLAYNSEKVFLTSSQTLAGLYEYLQTSPHGLPSAEIEQRQIDYGKNEVEHEQRKSPFSTW